MTPSDDQDPRAKRVDREISRYNARPDALIQVLHVVQDTYGYLPPEVLRKVADRMRVPASRAFGVATFYHHFSLKPKGEHQCVVCLGTACYVKGAAKILDGMRATFGLRPGEVTADGRLGLETARCLGACGLAPAVVLDQDFLMRTGPEDVAGRVGERISRGS